MIKIVFTNTLNYFSSYIVPMVLVSNPYSSQLVECASDQTVRGCIKTWISGSSWWCLSWVLSLKKTTKRNIETENNGECYERYVCSPAYNGTIFTPLKFSHSLYLLGLQIASLLNSVTVEVSRLKTQQQMQKSFRRISSIFHGVLLLCWASKRREPLPRAAESCRVWLQCILEIEPEEKLPNDFL